MTGYVVEGKAMWSHLVTPFDIFGNDCYQIYINADDKTMLRFADKGVEVKSVKVHYRTWKSLQSRLELRASYGDKDLPAPPVYDKDKNPITLTQEIPNFHPVKVKFEIEKGKGFNISKNYLILKAVMLLEDIPNEFENVESF